MINIPILSNRHFILLGIILLVLISTGCSNLYYDSIGYNLPTESAMLSITEKDEIKVSGAAIFSNGRDNVTVMPTTGIELPNNEKENTISITAGHGLTNRLALQGNFIYANNIREIGRQDFFQQTLAVGTFFKYEHSGNLRKKLVEKEFIADAYLGLGYGKVNHEYNLDSGFGASSANYIKAYLHTGISYYWGGITRVSLSSKLVYVNYISVDKINDIPNNDLLKIESISRNDVFVFMEFSPKVNFGKEYASFYITATGTPVGAIMREPPGRLNLLLMGLEFNVNEFSKVLRKRKDKNNHAIL